jgi:hypothetical protein
VIDRFIKVTKSLEGNLAERARGRLAACTASPSVYDDLRRAADVAATPYAIAVSMVLDQIDDKRVACSLPAGRHPRIRCFRVGHAATYDPGFDRGACGG